MMSQTRVTYPSSAPPGAGLPPPPRGGPLMLPNSTSSWLTIPTSCPSAPTTGAPTAGGREPQRGVRSRPGPPLRGAPPDP